MRPNLRSSLFGSAIIPLLVASGCSSTPEAAGTSADPIRDGVTDTTDRYAVFVQSANGTSCTGTLISPRWVLTANHCITGADTGGFADSDGGGLNHDYDVYVVPAGQSDVSIATATRFQHTTAKSGPPIVMKSTKMILGGLSGADDAIRDIALLHLDTRVPIALAKPLHVPLLGTAACPQTSDFNGDIIGYGGSGFDASFQSIGNGTRRLGNDADYARTASGTLGYYDSFWTSPFKYFTPADPIALLPAYAAYKGIMPGDSGGPLVYESATGPVLCGVASKSSARPRCSLLCGCGLDPVPCMAIFNYHAAVDTPDALSMFQQNVVKTDHFGVQVFEGECSAAPNSDDDTDGDGVVAACDVCPNVANEDQLDSDHDGIGDACDDCPSTWNKNQLDSDGDTRGDSCDACPHDPGSASDGYGDLDHDGVCDGVDNCASHPNASQLNTNAASETVHAAGKVWGDACEPVPQPASVVLPSSKVWMQMDNEWLTGTIYDVTENTVAIVPHASFPQPTLPASTPAVPIAGVTTSFRFCQPGPMGTAPFCDTPASIDDSQLHFGLTPDQETAAMPYRRITVAGSARGDTRTYDYDSAFLHFDVLTWDFNADAAYWKANGTMNVPAGTVADVGAGLQGTFWANASTPIGGLTDVGTGLHGFQLANAYVPIRTRYLSGSMWSKPGAPIFWGYDMKWLPRWPDFTQVLFGRDQMVLHPAARGATTIMSATAAKRLTDTSVRWVQAVEPAGAVGAGPIAIALRSDNTVVDALFDDEPGKKLLLANEARATITAGPEGAPVPAAGTYRAIYSRWLNATILIGAGRDGVASMWRSTSATSNGWAKLPTTTALGTALAATVSFVDGNVYVLDQINDVSGRARGRLLQVNPTSGAIKTLVDVPRAFLYDRLALTLDNDGSVLVSAASKKGTSRIVRISVAGGRTEVRTAYTPGIDLVHPIFPTENGYTLFTETGRGIAPVAVQNIDKEAASFADIGALL